MPAITGVTAITDLGDAVQLEKLDALAVQAREGHIYPAICMYRGPDIVRGAQTYKFPFLDATADAVAIPDGNDIALTTMTGDAGTATLGEVAQMVETTNPAILAQPETEPAKLINVMGSVHTKIDKLALGLFASATNVSDFSGTALTKARLVVATRDYKKQVPGSGLHALVLHPDQIADIQGEVVTPAGSSNADVALGYTAMFGPETGYKGTWQGFHLFETTNVQEADATNWLGAVFRIPRSGDDYGALGLAVWSKLMLLVRERTNATSHNLIAYADVGLTITQQTMIRGIASVKA